ncbi:hypothetical protein NDU88_003529, partial [Pleurodeles waltl]
VRQSREQPCRPSWPQRCSQSDQRLLWIPAGFQAAILPTEELFVQTTWIQRIPKF